MYIKKISRNENSQELPHYKTMAKKDEKTTLHVYLLYYMYVADVRQCSCVPFLSSFCRSVVFECVFITDKFLYFSRLIPT